MSNELNRGYSAKLNKWKRTSNIIRVIHNRDVKKFFKNNGDDSNRSNRRNVMVSSLLIDSKDSAIEVLNKQIIFRLGLGGLEDKLNLLFAPPEHWTLESGGQISQLAITYRVKGKKRGGNYTIHIPHFAGSKAFEPPKYNKGSQGVILLLKSGARMAVYAQSKQEGRRVLGRFLQQIPERFHTKDFRYVEREVQKGEMIPIRADFYEKGMASDKPKWRTYFNQR